MSNMKSLYGQDNTGYERSQKIKSGIVMAVLILLTIICLLPIYIMIVNATRLSADIQANGITLIPGTAIGDNINTLKSNEIYGYTFNALYGLRNSFFIAGCATILTVFFSALTAYGLVVYDFRIRGICYTFILAVMMVPTQVSATGFVQFMSKIGLTDSYIPLIVPAIAAPAVVFFMRQYMKSSFPLDIVEAARIDGSSEFRTFLTIALPIMKPAIAVQAIFAFINTWNNFYTASIILVSGKLEQRTMPMMVSSILTNDKLTNYGVNYLIVMLSVLPVCITYILLSRFIIEGVALGGVKE